MKNEILDDIFNDDLRDQLEPNEKVVWDGKPYNGNFIFIFLFLFLLYALYNFFIMKNGSIIPLVMVISFTLWKMANS